MLALFPKWSEKEWCKKEVYQKRDDLCFMRGRNETIRFDVDQHTKTRSLFPRASLPLSLGQDFAYINLFPYHKLVTCLGKTGFGLYDLGKAVKSIFIDKTEEFETFKQPLITRLKEWGKDAGLIAAVYAVNYYVLGNFLSSNLSWGLKVAAFGYSIYDPKGMKLRIANLEDMINVKALRDNEAPEIMNWKKSIPAILDGSYSLSRLLSMHRIGKGDEKLGKEARFVFPNKKEN